MPRPQAPVIVWPGGEHPFWLNLGELRALEQHCSAGFNTIFQRLVFGQFFVDDIFHVIRLGLIGGGMESAKAQSLAMKAFSENSPLTLARTAEPIMRISCYWDEVTEPTGEA